jgi:cell division protein ZapA
MVELESVTVKIFGSEYTLKGTADPEYVQKVASFVNDRMNEVARGSSVASTAKVAILAAVNIADELFRSQEGSIQSMAMLEDRSVQIVRLLSQELGTEPVRDKEIDSLPGA